MPISYTVRGDDIVIDSFTFSNKALVSYLSQMDESDRGQFLTEALEFGLNTLLTVTTQAEIREIESAVKQTKAALLETRTDTLLQLRQAFQDQLDESSPGSLINLFRSRVTAALQRDLDPDNADSPLNKIQTSLQDIIDVLQGKQAASSVKEKSTQKGNEFELLVNSRLTAIGTVHGDTVEFVGADGGGASKSGDSLVTFNGAYRKDKGSFTAIWESKTDGSFKSTKGVLKLDKVSAELNKALDVRKANCAVFVSDSKDLENQAEWQEFQENKLIVVVDRENPDSRVLQMAYLWTKSVAARNGARGDELDVGRLSGLMNDLEAQLKKFSSLKRNHKQIADSIKSATDWVEREEKEFQRLIREMSSEILSTEEGLT